MWRVDFGFGASSCPLRLIKKHMLGEVLGGHFQKPTAPPKPPWASPAISCCVDLKLLRHMPGSCSWPPAKGRDTLRSLCGLLSLAFSLAGWWGPGAHITRAASLCVREDNHELASQAVRSSLSCESSLIHFWPRALSLDLSLRTHVVSAHVGGINW